ncbi:MAG: hypothetical protein Ta2F_13810 [Termitinemataceae bacterium]|nr:MAG: hypothetical protein Ta2F_13810 [Termitinemataceae bacterium]
MSNYIKKLFLTCCLLCFVICNIFAQTITEETTKTEETTVIKKRPLFIVPTQHLYIGLYAGYANNNLYGSEAIEDYYNYFGGIIKTKYKSGNGWTIGIPIRYKFFSWLSLQAEPTFITKNYSYKRSTKGLTADKMWVDRMIGGTYQNTTNSFVDFPIMINISARIVNPKLRMFVNAGGFFGVWAASKVEGKLNSVDSNPYDPAKYGNRYAEYDEYLQFDKKRDNLFDAGLLVGLGMEYSFKVCTIFAEWRYNYSLTDLQKKYDTVEMVPNMNDTWTMQAGILFNSLLFKRKYKKG